MYGSSSSQSVGSTQPSSYKFEVHAHACISAHFHVLLCCFVSVQVCDSLINIGPIADATVGEPAFLSVSTLCSCACMIN